MRLKIREHICIYIYIHRLYTIEHLENWREGIQTGKEKVVDEISNIKKMKGMYRKNV